MAKRKTEEIEFLTEKALQYIPRPYTEDVIEDVLFTIENNGSLLKWYRKICEDYANQGIVNTWIGKYTKRITGMQVMCNQHNNIVRSKTYRTSLADTYTKYSFS